jgi:hypothetical protein
MTLAVSAGEEAPTRDFLPRVLPLAVESLLKAG